MLPRGARQIIIDQDGGHRGHAFFGNATMIILNNTTPHGFALFANLDDPDGNGERFSRLACRTMLEDPGTTEDELKSVIDTCIRTLREVPPETRNPSRLLFAPIDERYKNRIAHFSSSGIAGKLFDGTSVTQSSHFLYYDVHAALQNPELKILTLLALTNEIEMLARDGIETVIVTEEFWSLLKDPVTASYFESWMRRVGKMGVWLWMVTHEIGDISDTANAESFIGNFGCYFVLPSVAMMDPMIQSHLARIGLTKDEAIYLANAAPGKSEDSGSGQRLAYVIKGGRKRLISTQLADIAILTVGQSSVVQRQKLSTKLAGLPRFEAYAQAVRSFGGVHREDWYKHFVKNIMPHYDSSAAIPVSTDILVA